MASSLEQSVAEAADVVLRDGGTLRLRPPLSTDARRPARFFKGLSDQSRFLRFHGYRRIEPELVEPLLDPDWSERGALAGWLADREHDERVVAVGSYTRIGGSETAEMAFAVDDSEQGRGIGTRLLEQLAGRAREAGINMRMRPMGPVDPQFGVSGAYLDLDAAASSIATVKHQGQSGPRRSSIGSMGRLRFAPSSRYLFTYRAAGTGTSTR